ncbi:hypothetical protein KP509_05G038700 [Ceratopteris richardii]|uniref:Uncharacterized protein n=1 Tax=Ceratopteris richardii TaxID=49495 RepID=A0A8T2UTC2_CERRI|nr:hypothetical protein KP509_05G038700 [Ceratopteris richardii]
MTKCVNFAEQYSIQAGIYKINMISKSIGTLEVEKEISQIEQSRVEESSQVDVLEREINELNPQIQALNRELGSMKTEMFNLHQEDAGILNKISSLNYEILQKQQEGLHLRSRLVENPQELERTLKEKKAALLEDEALGIKCVGNCEVLKGKRGGTSKAERPSRNFKSDNILKERKATQKAFAKKEWALDVQEGELKWGVTRLEEHSEKLSHQLTAALKDLEAAKAEQQKLVTELNDQQCAVKERVGMQIEALCKNSEDICMKKKKMQIGQTQEMQDRMTRTALKFTERTPDSDILELLDD